MTPEYLFRSNLGEHWIPCSIETWEDKSERFVVRYLHPITEEYVVHLTPYKNVRNYSWQKLSERFATRPS